jgi:hypothetical protein
VRWCCCRDPAQDPDPNRRLPMIVGMNHFTVTAEDEKKTLDFYTGLLGL